MDRYAPERCQVSSLFNTRDLDASWSCHPVDNSLSSDREGFSLDIEIWMELIGCQTINKTQMHFLLIQWVRVSTG